MSTSLSSLQESDEKYFMKMINHKAIWKDRSIKAANTISNCINIEPFQSLSSYHLWMRRNLILLPERDEFVYISGCNVIVENLSTKKQKIIPIANDCHVTSINSQESSTGERILLIGEKVKANSEKKYVSGRVEVINLDCKVLPKHFSIDLGVYVYTDSFIFDCVVPAKSDVCFIVVKNLNTSDPQSKIFIWNYVNRIVLDIEDFKYLLNGISRNPYNPYGFMVYSDQYLALWEFNLSKKDIILEHQFYNKDTPNNDKITNAEFLQYNNKHAIAVSFKSEWFEIFEIIPDEYEQKKYEYVLYLRINFYSFFDENWVNIKPHKKPYVNMKDEYLDNFSEFNTMAFTPNFGLDKPTMNMDRNYIKYIISRDKYVLLFIERSQIVIIMEFIENESKCNDEDNQQLPKIKVTSIDKIEHEIKSKCSIGINSNLTRMLIVNGESIYKFYDLLSKKRSGNEQSSESYFSLTEVTMEYFKYKINFVDGSPNFVFEEQLLKHTGLGYPAKSISISETPKILMINNGENEQDLYFYRQKCSGNEENFNKIKITEGGSANFIHSHVSYYQENTEFEFFIHKKLEENPLQIAFSPLGTYFFVSFKDYGYLYGILGQEIKEVFKVSMYCRACVFDESGTYLAFATSELENDFTINVYNVSTFEYEYMITRVPSPTKLVFVDNSRILVAQFNDNSTNLIGWRLNWNKRLIKSNANGQKEKQEKEDDNVDTAIKISDFSGNIMDFVYDSSLDHCLITSADKRQRVYKGFRDDKHWEFCSDVEYPCCLLVKAYDSIVFGTSNGSLRSCLWPITNMHHDSNIDHPDYTETTLHTGKVTSIALSKDCTFLYSSGEDGSVFVSCITAITNDIPVTMQTFIYFDVKNYLPKKMHFDYQDVVNVTDQIYQSKVESLKKKKNAISGMISEFVTNKEKLVQNNAGALDKKRTELTDILEEKVRAVKEKENEKEKETKRLKEERESKIKVLKDELNVMKKEFKVQKEAKQTETTKLINCIKIAKEKFNQRKNEIEAMRNKTNTNIVNSLENMYKILQDKKIEIDKTIEDKKKKFTNECDKNEDYYESDIRQKEKNFKLFIDDFEAKRKETENLILKKNKDNKNYDEKIKEWDNHLKELKINNEELMETYIFNTLKLNQMNQLLSENESKISGKEKIVKEKRELNDRLEQLRFVLEYQIKNLILEKTPIEEQIKNFEALHSDFYKRFNLLYAELLNISDLIENNQNCIKTYRDELSGTKKQLYQLKNLYKSIDVALNSILKSKLESKKIIIDKIFSVYKTYLSNFNDDKQQQKVPSAETKLQTKNIEKEIYHQKNNVLRELIDKRSERKRIGKEKELMMRDIRLDNQLLIQECSNIRDNLEDILKNINDIEKKFIELTNNNTVLNKDENILDIRGQIKKAKDNIMILDGDKTKIAKTANREKLPSNIVNNSINRSLNEEINIVKILSAEDLLKKQQLNSLEMKHQQEEVEKMQMKLKELVGDNRSGNGVLQRGSGQSLQSLDFSSHNNNNNNGLIGNAIKTEQNQVIKNVDNSRVITIKTNKYYDIEEGNIKS